MKPVFLICVLSTGCLCGVRVHIRVAGTLSCSSAPFRYAIDLLEDDYFDDEIDALWVRTSNQSMVHYEVSGWATEGIFDNSVEPFIIIYHTCGTELGCACKEWVDIKKDMDVLLDVNLDMDDVKCSQCAGLDKKKKMEKLNANDRRGITN